MKPINPLHPTVGTILKPAYLCHITPRRCLRQPVQLNPLHHRRRYVQPPPKPPVDNQTEPSESFQVSSIPGSTEQTLPHPIFSRAPSERIYIPPVEDGNAIHPAAAGFIAGAMLAFSISYIVYYFSGTFYIKKGWGRDFKELNKTQSYILGIPDPKLVWKKDPNPYVTLSGEEKLEWLRQSAVHYSPFMPNSEIYVAMRWAEVEDVLKDGGEDAFEQAVAIVDECAKELKKEVNESAVGIYIGRVSWGIVRKHMDRIADLGKTEEQIALEKKKKGGPK